MLGLLSCVSLCACSNASSPDDEADDAAKVVEDGGPTVHDAAPFVMPEAGVVEAGAHEAGVEAGTRASVFVGLNPAYSEDLLLADLEVVALGSRATTVALRSLEADAVADTLARLELFVDQGLDVLFAIDLVHGERQLIDFDDAALERIKDIVDQVFERQWPLHAIVFGEGLDVFDSQLDAPQSYELTAFVSSAISYAFEHPNRMSTTRVGYSTTFEGWVDSARAYEEWTSRSDVVALSWFGLANTGRALADTVADVHLQRAIEVAEEGGVKLALRELSYANATSAGSNRAQQEAFYRAVFSVVRVEAETLPFVAISALDSPPQQACEAFTEDFRLPAVATEARCSIALRTSSGEPTPAYQVVVDTIATLDGF
jgi:hypothetical protein